MELMKDVVKSSLGALGFELRRKWSHKDRILPVEFSSEERDLFLHVKNNKLTVASDERLFATMMACKYAVERGIDGDFVECGVWQGGNSVVAAGVFRLYRSDKKVYLFDTFAGMSEPTSDDVATLTGERAIDKHRANQKEDHNAWGYVPLEKVRENFSKAGLLGENVVFVKGDVLETLNGDLVPERVAVLRLDTDWYESTRKELEILYPRLSVGGVLIIDDYGHYAGAQKATEEYFQAVGARPFLQYTDYTGRAGVKL